MFPAGVGRKSLMEAYDSHQPRRNYLRPLPLARSDTDHGASAMLLVARCGTAGGKASRDQFRSCRQSAAFFSSSKRIVKPPWVVGRGAPSPLGFQNYR